MIFILNRSLEIVDSLSIDGDFSKITPYFDDEYKQDLHSGAEIYTFSTKADSKEAQHLSNGNYIVFKENKYYKLFNIINVSEVHDKNFTKTVYCEMAGIELINQPVRPMKVNNVNLRQLMETILQDSDWQVGMIDAAFVETIDFELTEYKTIYNVIQDYVIGLYKGEIRYRVEIERNVVIGKYIDVFKQRGIETDYVFSYSSDIEVISRKIDSGEIATALIGEGRNGITFKEVDAPDKPANQDFLTDEIAYKQWNIKGSHLFGISKHDTDSPQELLKLTREDLAKRCIPKAKYEVKIATLGRRLEIGDTIRIVDHEFNPPLYLSARVSQITKHHCNPDNDEVVLSNYIELKSNITDQMREVAKQLEGYVDKQFPIGGDKIENGAINGDKLHNGQIIKGTHIFANSVTADHIKAGSIVSDKIKADSIESEHIKSNTITSRHISSGSITADKIQAGSITGDLIQGNTITGGHIQAGSIVAGSGIIAEGAIGSAEISEIDANKIKAGTIDASKVTIAGPNSNLLLRGNRIQVFEGHGNEKVERVSLGDVDNDGTLYGLRVRGKDGRTILYDENGVYNEGITDGAITNEKISGETKIDAYKLDINSVIREINGSSEKITGTKIQIGDADLLVELSNINNNITEDKKIIDKHTTDIKANTDNISLKLNSTEYQEDKKELSKRFEKNETSIDALKDSISLKVEKTEVEKITNDKIDDIEIGGRNLARGTKSEYVSYSDFTGENDCFTLYKTYLDSLKVGDTITISLAYKWENIVPLNGMTTQARIQGSGDVTSWNSGGFPSEIIKRGFSGNGEIEFSYEYVITENAKKNNYWSPNIRHDGIQSGRVYCKEFKVEKGNKKTNWSSAPEDVQSQIDDNKTEITKTKNQVSKIDLDLGGISSKVSTLEQTNIKNRKVASFRYIRDWLNGSTVNTGNHWVELQVFANAENIAQGITPTSEYTIKNHQYYTDGVVDSNYTETITGAETYLQIDLGTDRNDIDMIKVWHYWADGRSYNHKLEVSRDGETWYELFNSDNNGRYKETEEGRTYIINETYTENRLKTAEEKITPDAIVNTIKQSQTDGKNTFVQGTEFEQTIKEFNFKFEKNGSENVIKNAWFLGKLTHWEAVQWDNGDTSNRDISISHTVGNEVDNWLPLGIDFIKISNSGNIGNRHWGGIQQVVKVEAGEKYTLSYYIAGHRIRRNVIEIKRGDNNAWLDSTTIDDIKSSKEHRSKLDEDFTFVKYTFTVPSDCSSIRICIWSEGRLDGGGASYAWLAKTQLEKGDIATARKLYYNEISNNSTTIDEIGVKVNSKNESQFARMDNEFFSVYNGGESPVNRQAFMGLEDGVPTILLGAHGINPGVSVFGGTHLGFKHYAPDRSPLSWGGSWGMLEYKLDSGAADISRLGFSQDGNLSFMPHVSSHFYNNLHVHGSNNWEVSASMGIFPTYIKPWNLTGQLRGIKVHSHVIGSDNDNNIYCVSKSGDFSRLHANIVNMQSAATAYSANINLARVYRDEARIPVELNEIVEGIALTQKIMAERQEEQEEAIVSNLIASVEMYEMMLEINPNNHNAKRDERISNVYASLIKRDKMNIRDVPKHLVGYVSNKLK